MAHWLNKRVPASADGQDVDRAKDWLTALSPLFLMMVVNYHWPAVLAVLTAAHLAPETGVAEAARLFSREIEHSEENLERLAEDFCFDPRLGPERFFTSLK